MTREVSYYQVLLRQYKMLPKLMRAPVDSDEAMEALGALLSRDELGDQEGRTLQRSLRRPDLAFAEALAGCDDAWRDCILKWSSDCNFASSAWWLSVYTNARQLSGQTTKLSDLFASVADIWVTVTDEAGQHARDLVRRVDRLLEGVVSGVEAVGHGIGGESWNTNITPAVAYHKSMHIGFSLPRREIAGVPGQIHPWDREAAQRCIDSLAVLGKEGPTASIEELIPWEETQEDVRRSYNKIRKSLAPNASLELGADTAITRTQAHIRYVRPYEHHDPKRDVRLHGVVRAIDLEACRLKLRNDDGSKTMLRYDGDALFPGRLAPGEWLDKPVNVRAFTYKRADPPSSADLFEISIA